MIWAGRERGRGKEGCALRVSPRVWAGTDEFGWFGSRIVWVTGKTGMVKCVWVCVYAPVNEKGMKDKMKLEKFWEDLDQLLKKFENVRRVFLLGDMNASVGSTETGGVVGKYGVEGVNENGQYLMDICAERGLFLSNHIATRTSIKLAAQVTTPCEGLKARYATSHLYTPRPAQLHG